MEIPTILKFWNNWFLIININAKSIQVICKLNSCVIISKDTKTFRVSIPPKNHHVSQNVHTQVAFNITLFSYLALFVLVSTYSRQQRLWCYSAIFYLLSWSIFWPVIILSCFIFSYIGFPLVFLFSLCLRWRYRRSNWCHKT